MRSVTIIMSTTLIFGALLGVADHYGKRVISLEKMTLGQAMIIGFSQMLSLIPGTSRSGITMTAALMMGFNREAAARFLFPVVYPCYYGGGPAANLGIWLNRRWL